MPETKSPKGKTAADKPGRSFRFTDFSKENALSGTDAPLVFNDGLPDTRLAPMDSLARAYKRIFHNRNRWRMMGYGNEKGEERLRAALSDMLSHDRGLNASAEQICVTRGSQMALYLTAHTLLKPGDHVAIENPGYVPAYETFKQAGARVHPVRVDEQGICVVRLEALCRRQKITAVYVTPHHQFPTTVTMKADRRLRLLELSNRYGFAIIEDDYDHEFHFGSRSMLPLAGDTQAGNVIYVGSLSKLVAPAVRIGYVSGPPEFVDSMARLRLLVDRQGDTVMENAVAELMTEGEIRKHARRALSVYRERRENMARSLDGYLGQNVSYHKPEGGLAYWLTWSGKPAAADLAQRLARKGVSVLPTERFFFDGKPKPALRLGYASLTPEEAEKGIRLLASVFTKK